MTRLVEQSLYDLQFENILAGLPSLLEGYHTLLPEGTTASFLAAVARAFSIDSLFADVHDYYREQYDPRLADILAWMERPDVVAMWTHYRTFSEVEDTVMVQYYDTHPPDSADLVYLDHVVETLEAKAQLLTLFVEINVALVRGIGAMQGRVIPAAQLGLMRTAMRERIPTSMKEAPRISFWYLLQHETADDVRMMMDFYGSDANQWFTRFYTASFAFAFERAGDRMQHLLMP